MTRRYRVTVLTYRSVPAESATEDLWIEEGEFIVVPHGIEHRPVSDEECHVLLFESAATLNTGNVQNDFTARKLDSI